MKEPRLDRNQFELSKEMQNRLKTAVKSMAAPPHLETRVRAIIRATRERPVWYPRIMVVAAGVVICVGMLIAYQLGHLRLTRGSQESYIASVSSRIAGIMRAGLGDHIHCAVYRKFPKDPPDVKDMAEKLGPEYRELVPVMTGAVRAPYRLALAHQCRYHGRRFVHLVLKDGSSLMSVVIARKRDGESFRTAALEPALVRAGLPVYESGVQQFQIAAFETSAHLVYLISDRPRHGNTETLVSMAPGIAAVLARAES
jgi:hypothetical protein